MKKLILLFTIIIATVTISCHNKATPAGTSDKLKARFEIAGLCSNYTFSVIEGNIDTALIEESWTNPQTDKTYKNAFGISNPCDLPKDLKEGDEFYFEIDKKPSEQCVACMAYYPTPVKKLALKVIK
ncbi:MAG TPA: hypothetical protein PKE30_07600 [Niabella sp.]|nr:hypothetical protein [Niabella sp.]